VVERIRRLMKQCHDELPPTEPDLPFISDADNCARPVYPNSTSRSHTIVLHKRCSRGSNALIYKGYRKVRGASRKRHQLGYTFRTGLLGAFRTWQRHRPPGTSSPLRPARPSHARKHDGKPHGTSE
jgi:hypothetical protein